jgi:PLP dependent protein
VDENRVLAIRARAESVLAQIAEAARQANRSPEEIKLLTVTKTFAVADVQAAHAAGLTRFGENYAEEAVEKIHALGAGLEWHMIGHVQSRKAALVAPHFALVHSLDSLKLARRLNDFALQAGRVLPVLLECNVSGEVSKYGWQVWDEAHMSAFYETVAEILAFSHLQVSGLMTMPPYTDDPHASRPYFARLRALSEALAGRFPQADWSELSMGTSADFVAAVHEGATIVRVGTAIMGTRE